MFVYGIFFILRIYVVTISCILKLIHSSPKRNRGLHCKQMFCIYKFYRSIIWQSYSLRNKQLLPSTVFTAAIL